MPVSRGEPGGGAGSPTFQEQVDALCVPQADGTRRVDVSALRALVAADPEQTAATCRTCVTRAKEQGRTWRGYAQMAMTLAALYESVFDDDILAVWVTDEFDRAGISVPNPAVRVVDPRTGALSDPDERPEEGPVQIAVERRFIDACDIRPLVVHLSHQPDGTGPEQLRRLRGRRGRVLITFDIPASDPREVWEVPEVRDYVGRLAEAMPYLPYYFLPRDFGTLFTWLACLAPPEAWSPSGIRLLHPDVVQQAALAVHSVRKFAAWLGDDPDAAVETVFSPLPGEFMAYVHRVQAELDRRLGDAS